MCLIPESVLLLCGHAQYDMIYQLYQILISDLQDSSVWLIDIIVSFIVYSIQMELSELPKLEDSNDTPAKDTYRTLKPPDRCVISYNFEQTHSLNVTHNLLIGMFNEQTKKTHKQRPFKSVENNKNKLFSIVPTNKKIARQEQKTISKTHESKVQARKYIPAGSPRKEEAQSENYHISVEKFQPQSNQNHIEHNARGKVEDLDGACNQLDGSLLVQSKAFDASRQVQCSSHQKRWVIKQEKQSNRLTLEGVMEGRRQQAQVEYNQEQQMKQDDEQNNIFGNQAATDFRTNRDQPVFQFAAEQNKTSAQKNNKHQHQIAFNQPIRRQTHNHHIAQQLPTPPEQASLERLSQKTEHRLPSRKQIQDQQLCQLEQRLRKHQGTNLKKYNFKKTEGNQQLLPFNSEIDPYRHQASKYIRRTSSSKKIHNMTQTNSYHRSHKNNGQKEPKNRGLIQAAVNGDRRDRTGGKQNCSMQKQNNNKGMPSIHQIRQSKAKQFSLNQLHKYNKNPVSPIHPNNAHRQATTALRKLHDINTHPVISQGSVLKSDLTENNVIKGFRVEANHQLNAANSIKGNSLSSSNQATEKKMTQIDPQRKSKRSRETQNPNKKIRDNPRSNTQNKDIANLQIHHNQSHIISSRTAKPNTSLRPTETIESLQHPPNNTPQNEHSEKSPLNASTIARTAKDKAYYSKNWKESQLNKTMKESRDNTKRKESQQGRDKKGPSNSNKASGMKPKRKDKSAEIDLDAEEEDKFGLLAQKNVTRAKNKKTKISKQGKKTNQPNEEIKEESQKSIEQISEDECSSSQKQQNSNEQNEEQSIVQQDQSPFSSQQPPKSQISGNYHQTDNNSQPTLKVTLSKQGAVEVQKNKEGLPHGEQPSGLEKHSAAQKLRCQAEAVKQIEQLIQQNGQLSRIDSMEEAARQNFNRKCGPQVDTSTVKKDSSTVKQEQQGYASVAPIANQRSNNLEELLIATEELPPQYKISQPALQQVEQQFAWSKEQIELYQQMQQQPQNHRRSLVHESTAQQQQIKKEQNNKIKQEQNNEYNDEEMEVNLPLPDLTSKKQGSAIKKKHMENQTDYHEELRDQIEEFGAQQRREENDVLEANQEEISKTEDFFAHNFKELSKVTDLANLTNYQPIDKNIIHYARAPILSFLYQMPKRFHNSSQSFIPAVHTHKLLSNIRGTEQIGVQPIDQAVNILISIDPWIIERVFEPFEDKEERIGVWLYCRGQWTLFLEKKQTNFRKILLGAITKAIQMLNIAFDLQTVLKLVSGVRIIRLKSSKKRVFKQLEFSLKKGHTLKALPSKQSKWGEKLFTVNSVQVTKDKENVLQIKEQNETCWVKQTKLKQIFEHFLLICTRKAHFWTHRTIQHKPSYKSVITISSAVPAHGSITLFYSLAAASNLLLYKQLQSKVLKFMGKIQEKSNQNGNLYFQFRLHGNYCIFLEAPENCLLAVQSTSQLQIGDPQYVVSQTLKNEQCEYLQLSGHLKHKSNTKQLNRSGETLLKLREKFIDLVVQK